MKKHKIIWNKSEIKYTTKQTSRKGQAKPTEPSLIPRKPWRWIKSQRLWSLSNRGKPPQVLNMRREGAPSSGTNKRICHKNCAPVFFARQNQNQNQAWRLSCPEDGWRIDPWTSSKGRNISDYRELSSDLHLCTLWCVLPPVIINQIEDTEKSLW